MKIVFFSKLSSIKIPSFRFQLNEQKWSVLPFDVHYSFFSRLLNDDAHFSSNYMINVQVFHTFIDITASDFQPHLKSLLAMRNHYHIVWSISLAIVYKSIKKHLNLHENFMHSLSSSHERKISHHFNAISLSFHSLSPHLNVSVAVCLSPVIWLFF